MGTDHLSDAGPVPGEPRDPGPRPNAAPRDLAWACLAAAVAGITVLQLIGPATTAVGVRVTRGSPTSAAGDRDRLSRRLSCSRADWYRSRPG